MVKQNKNALCDKNKDASCDKNKPIKNLDLELDLDLDLDNLHLHLYSENNLQSLFDTLCDKKIDKLCLSNNIPTCWNIMEKKKILFKIYHEIILTNRLTSKMSVIIDDSYIINNFNLTNTEKDRDVEIDYMALYCLNQYKQNNINNKYLKYYTDLSYNDKIDLITKYINKIKIQTIINSFINENNINEVIEEEFNIDFNIENLKKIDNDDLNNKINNFIDEVSFQIILEEKEDFKNYLNNMILKKYKDIIFDYVKNNTNKSYLDNEILLLNKEIKDNYIPLSNFKNITINNFNLEHLLKKFNLLDLYYVSYKINDYLTVSSLSKSIIIKNISERYFNNILYYISEIKRENKNKKDEILKNFSDNFILLFDCDIKVTISTLENINDDTEFDLFNITSFTKKITSYVRTINFNETIKIYTILYPDDNDIFFSINYRECQKNMIKYLINVYENKKYIYIKNDIQLIYDIDEYLVLYFCKYNYLHLFNVQLSTNQYCIKILKFLETCIKSFPINYLINFIFKHNLFKFEEYYIHHEKYIMNLSENKLIYGTFVKENIINTGLNTMVRTYYEKIFCKFVSEDILSIHSYFTNKNAMNLSEHLYLDKELFHGTTCNKKNNVFFFQKLSKYINFKYNTHSEYSSSKYFNLEDCIDKVYERCEYDFFGELINELLKINFKFERESKYFRSFMIKTNIEILSLDVEENLDCPICYEKINNKDIIKFDCNHHVCNCCYEEMHKNRSIYNNCVCCLCRNNISDIYIKNV